MARIELSNIGGGGGGSTTLALTTTGTSGSSVLTTVPGGYSLNIPTYQGALSLSTAGTSGASTLVGNTLTIPTYQGQVSLTTTGTSGASTFVADTLNIPQYQGALTLTTTGTSGAATLVGNTLNIPQYSGGGGTPAGNAGEVQFNSTPAGSFAASANLAWDNTATQLNIGVPSAPTGKLNVKGSGTTSGTVNFRLTDSGNTELFKVLDNGSANIGTAFNWNNTNGRLGIGTSTPASPLTVIGNGDVVRIDGSAVASRVTLILAAQSTSYSQITGSGTALYISGGSSTDIGISPGLTDYHIFNKSGNVGIGTLSPSGRMNVRGSNTSSGTNALLVQNSTPSDLYKIENNGKISYWATNTGAGTTGAQTIDKPSGTVNFGIGASSLVVTNALCTTDSIVFATVRTNDATAYIKNVAPAGGSFTINLGAAATAETSVGFFIIN